MNLGAGRRHGRLQALALVLLLAALVAAVFWQVGGHPFAGLDDDVVVLHNPRVLGGVTADGLRWAFTAVDAGLWHPLTWISHMIDVRLFGTDAGRHHLTNVLLHAASTALLFLTLAAMTGSRGRSAFVAALFAVHPLHVESVAWVAERKDVLSGLFWMLTLGAYLWHVRRPGPWRYAAVVGAFLAGLLAKPMLVTLPFVLLLLDFWPLGRLRARRLGPPTAGSRPLVLALEKLPLFALAAGAAAVTVVSASKSGSLGSVAALPPGVRAANAAVSYAWYLLESVAPRTLAVFYPHPGAAIDTPALLAALALLAAVSWGALRWRRAPAAAVGWLWFLGTLVPVIGLLQSGAYARADRFTYLPLVGLALAAAWGVPTLLPRGRRPGAAAPAAITVAVALAAAAHLQAGFWRNDEALFGRAIAVTTGNWLAHGNLGATFMEQGRLTEAAGQFRLALQHQPAFLEARLNLGQTLDALGSREEAGRVFEEAVRRSPADERAQFLLGRHLAAQGRVDEAIARLEEALRLNPEFTVARATLDALRAGAQEPPSR